MGYRDAVNFVGHAMAALWERDDPGFVLGAMLPDFATMCGARLVDASDGAIAAGVGFHHRTDGAFHGAPTFLRLCTEARHGLREAGVRRATALAAAHVGVELLLDGHWLDDPRVDAAYLDAIEHAVEMPRSALRWQGDDGAARFEGLCARLRAIGSPRAYRDAAEVGRRVERILAARPRLAPGPGDGERLVAWAVGARAGIVAAGPRVRAELRRALG